MAGYNYGTSESTENWDTANGSDAASILFGTPTPPLIPQFGCGTDGDNTFSLFIETTSSTDDDNGSFSRESAWRKAYRFLNRFDTGNISMDRFGSPNDGSATYNAQRSVFKTNSNYETPFDHKPPCRFPFFTSSNPAMDGETAPLIEILYSMALINIDTAADNWNGQLTSDGGVQWAIGSKGLGLRTNTTPEAMEFPLLKTNAGENFKVDTARSVIPAYSGEILSFQGDLNFDGDNLGFGYMGNTDDGGSIIYIDITQTDEVLRWNPNTEDDIDPEEWWVKTISGIQVKNSDNPKSGSVNFKKGMMAVVSNDKNNYIVSFTSPKQIPLSSWGNGQNIRVLFMRKKIIRLDDNNKPWDGANPAEYENIRYRSLADEFKDDEFFQVPTDPPDPPDLLGACCLQPGTCQQRTQQQCIEETGDASNWAGPNTTECTNCDDPNDGGTEVGDIRPFTTSLNGNLGNGTITINYPDGVNATDVTFEVYIEKDPESLS